MEPPIYLDYNATTPVDPRVVEAMVPFLSERFGNASSAHAYGYDAHAAIDEARSQIAALVGARPAEIVFTGGGSETDNLAIKGVAFARLRDKPHIVSTVIEHPAVLATLRYLRDRFDVQSTLVPVDQFGLVSPGEIARALRPETALVTVMHANNEVGTVQPIAEIGCITREAGVLLHVDAAQSAGKIPLDVEAMNVDLLTLAGHKLYGPKGIGALYIRRGTRLDPLIHGSSQEHGLRAGTENVASIVAMGCAAALAQEEVAAEAVHLTALRDRLYDALARSIPGLLLNGHPVHRLPNTLNVSFPGALGSVVLGCAPGVAASTGSACHASMPEPSPVLLAMGMSTERAVGAVRLSLGRWSTEEEVDQAADMLAAGYVAATGGAISSATA